MNSTEPQTQTTPPTKSSLTERQRLLVELMQQIKFGRIEHLRVWHGEPSFDPAPKVVKRLKIGGENGSRLEIGPDFLLKGHVVELFEAIRELDTGVIRAIDVKHGLPFSVEMEVPTGLGPWRGGALRG